MHHLPAEINPHIRIVNTRVADVFALLAIRNELFHGHGEALDDVLRAPSGVVFFFDDEETCGLPFGELDDGLLTFLLEGPAAEVLGDAVHPDDSGEEGGVAEDAMSEWRVRRLCNWYLSVDFEEFK